MITALRRANYGFVAGPISGRLKEMYVSGAENVYPIEVEQVPSSFEGALEAAAVGVAHPLGRVRTGLRR